MGFWDFHDKRYKQARALTLLSILALVFSGAGLAALFLWGTRLPSLRWTNPARTAVAAGPAPDAPAPTPLPEVVPPAFDLATQAIREGDSPKAESELRKAIAQGDHVEESLPLLGEILKENKKYDEAITVLDQSIARVPKPDRFFDRAQCHDILGHIDKATSDYDIAVEKAPANPLYTNKRYLFRIRSGRVDEVVQFINFQISLGATKGTNTWIMAAAAVALQQNHPGDAASLFRSGRELLTHRDFALLLSDPFFETYRTEPLVAEFFAHP